MKNLKRVLIVAFAIMMGVMTLACAKKQVQTKESEEIKKNGVLKIGVTNYPPMNYLDDNAQWTGFDTDVANEICKQMGVKAKFIEISWEAKETELASKNIDCLWNGMCITEERTKMWSVSNPYLNNTQAIVVKKDREKEVVGNIAGKKVVAEAGSTGEEKILGVIDDTKDKTVKVVAKDFFKDAKYTGVASMATALMDVENGVADCAVVDYVIAAAMVGPNSSYKDLVLNTENNFGDQYFGIAFRKGSDLCDTINQKMDELKKAGTLNTIAAKYGIENSLIK